MIKLSFKKKEAQSDRNSWVLTHARGNLSARDVVEDEEFPIFMRRRHKLRVQWFWWVAEWDRGARSPPISSVYSQRSWAMPLGRMKIFVALNWSRLLWIENQLQSNPVRDGPFYFCGGGWGGGGGGQLPKKFLHSKSRGKKSCPVGEGKKNRASLSAHRILLDQKKN